MLERTRKAGISSIMPNYVAFPAQLFDIVDLIRGLATGTYSEEARGQEAVFSGYRGVNEYAHKRLVNCYQDF